MKRAKVRRGIASNSLEGSLFGAIIQRAEQAGDFLQAEPILEYCHPCAPETDIGRNILRCPREFDFVPSLILENSEGIYLDCYLRGKISSCGWYSIRIGTMKTLGTDIRACKIMGELCGVLMYHARSCIEEQAQKDHSQSPRLAQAGARSPNHRGALVREQQ